MSDSDGDDDPDDDGRLAPTQAPRGCCCAVIFRVLILPPADLAFTLKNDCNDT